jgi:hypothetical protein
METLVQSSPIWISVSTAAITGVVTGLVTWGSIRSDINHLKSDVNRLYKIVLQERNP